MLNEVGELQSSNQDVWGNARVSFTIETREPTDDELIQRKFTFSHADKWDKWVVHTYEESRCDNTRRVSDRNWRRTRKIHWDDAAQFPEVPPEVENKLQELLGLEELNIQNY